MECKHIYYEVIESFPKELESKIPLFTIWNYTIYLLYAIFINLKNIFTFKIKLGKKEEYIGRESNKYVRKNFIIPDTIKEIADKNEVQKTITEFLEEKKAIKELSFLIKEYNFNIDEINLPITLKKRTEFIKSNNCRNKVFITINKPKFLYKSKLFIKSLPKKER